MNRLDQWRHHLREAADALLGDALRAHSWLRGGLPPSVVAIGASTVDWERVAKALGNDTDWPQLERDPLLGATVHQAPGADEPLYLLLEPDTEGPLAAGLASHGEGLAAIYLRVGPLARRSPTTRREARAGPLGAARLLSGPRWGPFVIVLEPRDTIGR